ncbi:MAG: hypothetical protein KGJ13_04210 [Patescibacteria group bacterium]|nr:hypothetical protein [Patescibacteria group bacterium]
MKRFLFGRGETNSEPAERWPGEHEEMEKREKVRLVLRARGVENPMDISTNSARLSVEDFRQILRETKPKSVTLIRYPDFGPGAESEGLKVFLRPEGIWLEVQELPEHVLTGIPYRVDKSAVEIEWPSE